SPHRPLSQRCRPVGISNNGPLHGHNQIRQRQSPHPNEFLLDARLALCCTASPADEFGSSLRSSSRRRSRYVLRFVCLYQGSCPPRSPHKAPRPPLLRPLRTPPQRPSHAPPSQSALFPKATPRPSRTPAWAARYAISSFASISLWDRQLHKPPA